MVTMIIYVLTGAVVLLVAYWVQHRKKLQNRRIECNIPGPEIDSFIFGNFWRMEGRNVPASEQLQKQYGDIFAISIGSTMVISVMDIELIKLMQVKEFHKFPMRKHMWIEGGAEKESRTEVNLISSEISPKRWKEQRSLITTSFTSAKLKESIPMMNQAIDEMLQILGTFSDQNKEFDIYKVFQGFTMDTVGRSAFGVMTEAQKNPDDPFFMAAKDIFETFAGDPYHFTTFLAFIFEELHFIIEPIRTFQWEFLRFINHAGVMVKTMEKIIYDRRKEKKDTGEMRHDLLQNMLDATIEADESGTKLSKTLKMTDMEVATNGILFFEAGFETTSTLLGFIAHVFVSKPEIQDRIREEAQQFEQDNGGELNYNVFKGLEYLEAVIYETLRYYPPITFFVTRTPIEDYEYKGMIFKKGTPMNILPHLLHKDPRHWEDPTTFNPGRFMGSEKQKNLSAPYYQPFGYGPRACVGLRFAMLEAKLAIVRLVLNYKLIPSENTEVKDITFKYKPISMTPANGVLIKVVPV